MAGIANPDVAASSTAALSGMSLITLREGDKQIPVVGRLRLEERAQLSDLQNLYIYASQNSNKALLLYAIFVLDLKLVQWNTITTASASAGSLN